MKTKRRKNTRIFLEDKKKEHEDDGDTKDSLSSWRVTNNLENRLGEQQIQRRIETIKTTALLKSDMRLKRILEPSYHSDLSKKNTKHLYELVLKTNN